MKRITVILLALMLALSLVACDTTPSESTASKAESTDTSSAVSETESEEESEAESEVSEEESEEVSEPEPEPEEEVLDTGVIAPGSTLNRNTAYCYIAENDGHPTSYNATSIRFNQWNGEIALGDTVFLTGPAGTKLVDACTGDYADLAEFAVIVVTYDMTTYRYTVTAVADADADKSALTFPEDGFAIAVSDVLGTENETLKTSDFKKINATNVTNVSSYTVGSKIELDGISALQIHWAIGKATTAPTLDGVISAGEYGTPVLSFDGDTEEVDYRGFDATDKYATGAFYAKYDSEYLYLAWTVASEKHSCPIALGSETSIWQYDCAQIVIDMMNPNDSRNLDGALCYTSSPSGTNTKGYDWTVEIGIAVNDDGETLLCPNWFDNNMPFEGKASRDDVAAVTVYEVKISLEELNKACPDYVTEFTSGTQIGISFSINTNDGATRVVRLRDGGGIYGSNDLSKIPCATLE